MIARRQPMASDLRSIITAIHVISDLKRIGDMTKQLARRSLKIEELNLQLIFYNGVHNMIALVLRQIKESLDAYSSRDVDGAIQVCNRDDDVDAMYTSLFRALLTYYDGRSAQHPHAPICCSAPRAWNALMTTPPISPSVPITCRPANSFPAMFRNCSVPRSRPDPDISTTLHFPLIRTSCPI
ncbi:MAG: hypothetical protein MO846_03630 [Candidatus Devosia symbiotica]|nr:hypothetical protein [Candidatus Devosia symbiotica]